MQLDDSVIQALRCAESARREGVHEAALVLVEQARREATHRAGPRSAALAFCAYVAGTIHEARRDLLAAEAAYLEGVRGFIDTLGLDHPNTAEALQAAASVQVRLDPYPRAARALEESLNATARSMGLFDPSYLDTLIALARYHYQGGDHARTREAIEAALCVLQLARADGQSPGPEHATHAQRAAVLCTALGDSDRALALLSAVGG